MAVAGRFLDLEHAVLKDSAVDSGSALPALPPFHEIYRLHFDFVWSVARHLGVGTDAMDDVVQEAFIVIHSRLHTLERPEALRSWIYGVVRRTVSAHHRSRRTRDAAGAAVAIEGELAPPPATPLELTEKKTGLELLASLLAQLDDTKREVLVLVELQEMTVPEVADALEIPLNTAYSRLRAARQAFDAILVRHEARGGAR
ncbi:MAG: sigma-70 family RNA polymerase sigma factor [Polyangiaceae bacterium]